MPKIKTSSIAAATSTLGSPLSVPHKSLATAGAAVNYRDSWRIFRIVAEMIEGYQFLGELSKEIIIFGSARLPSNNKYYKVAESLGRLLGKNGFTTITGGGPGLMEAANKGAFEVGGESVGLNIQLPMEQRINPYVRKATAFYYFFTRKVMMTSPGNAFVFFPGGYGSLDEFFEVVDYMELGFMSRSPIVLVGREYWEPIVNFLRTCAMDEVHSISPSEMENWHIVETADEAFTFIKDVPDQSNLCENEPNNPLCQESANDWRIFRIMSELVEGFEFLTTLEHDVTVLGTKSCLPGSKYYNAAYEVGRLLGASKHTIITGGGPGIMEAANKGAFEVGARSVGITMKFHGRERINNFVTSSKEFFFPFIRKLIITAPSEAFVFFPGGFGTLHQLFELLTLQETQKMELIPILLYGVEYWKPLLEIIHNLNINFKTISPPDELLLRTIDKPEDVLSRLQK